MGELLSNARINIFIPKVEKLNNMEDVDVLRHFISEMRHPSMPRESTKLAEHILHITGRNDEYTEDTSKQAWHDRMKKIALSTSVSDSQWDVLINPENAGEGYDSGFADIVNALKDSRGAEELETERDALFALLDLRVASLKYSLDDPEIWTQLVKRLIVKNDS